MSSVTSSVCDDMRHRHRRAFTPRVALRVVVSVVLAIAFDGRKFARASRASIPADDATLETLPAMEDALNEASVAMQMRALRRWMRFGRR